MLRAAWFLSVVTACGDSSPSYDERLDELQAMVEIGCGYHDYRTLKEEAEESVTCMESALESGQVGGVAVEWGDFGHGLHYTNHFFALDGEIVFLAYTWGDGDSDGYESWRESRCAGKLHVSDSRGLWSVSAFAADCTAVR
jgi:hypothetical protein